MDEAKEQIDHDEDDATEDKAKAIGKELGVVEDKSDEDVPDYNIQEEPDERIAKQREPKDDSKSEKKEWKKLSSKEKRDAKKKRWTKEINQRDVIINQQQAELNHLKQWKGEVDTRLSGINRAEVDKAWNDTVAVLEKAKKDYSDSFTEGDGVKNVAALALMSDANDRLKQIRGISEQLKNSPAQTQKPNGPDPVIVNKAKAWAERHASWYNPDGKDVDSEIAKAISGVLANEGYDPKSDDFWDELDDRVAKKMPDKFDEQEEDDDDEPIPKAVRKRTTPPVASGAKRGDVAGKKTVTLPTSYINMLKANGIWDDVKRRNKIIAERERILKESEQ